MDPYLKVRKSGSAKAKEQLFETNFHGSKSPTWHPGNEANANVRLLEINLINSLIV